MSKNIHITHRADKSWAVIGEKDSKASSLHKTQGDAIAEGRKIAKNNKSELIIHDRENKIRDKDSFGNDPHPPIDRKH